MINRIDCANCTGVDVPQMTWEHINNTGLSIIGTEVENNGKIIPMTYSIGITYSCNQPELVLFGIPQKHAAVFINMYYDMLTKGQTFKEDISYDEFADGYSARFLNLTKENYREYLYQATDFNITNNLPLRAMQMVYPDAEKRWPWEDGVDEDFKTMVNVLNEPEQKVENDN